MQNDIRTSKFCPLLKIVGVMGERFKCLSDDFSGSRVVALVKHTTRDIGRIGAVFDSIKCVLRRSRSELQL